MDQINEYYKMGLDMLVMYVPKIVTAILVFVIGLWIVKFLVSGFNKASRKSKIDRKSVV